MSSQALSSRFYKLQKTLGFKTSLPCVEARLRLIHPTLCYSCGVADPPRGAEYWIATDPLFQHAVNLVAAIRASPEFSDHFCVGVAGMCYLRLCSRHLNNTRLQRIPTGIRTSCFQKRTS